MGAAQEAALRSSVIASQHVVSVNTVQRIAYGHGGSAMAGAMLFDQYVAPNIK